MSIKSVLPSNYLILCCPLLLPSIFPRIRVFSSELILHIRWPKCQSFNFNISTSNEYSWLISFRTNWFDLLAVQGTLKSLLQHHNQKHEFFSTQSSLWSNSHIPYLISHISHDYWENHSFDSMDLCQQSNVSAFYYTV